jgi:hypothetical protein
LLNGYLVEDFCPGYPRFTALIGAHPPFHISRRFSQLRSHLLLLKQDELSILEAKLQAVDEAETRELYLGNHRRDKNPVRRQILEDIDGALKDYGMVSLHPSSPPFLRRGGD